MMFRFAWNNQKTRALLLLGAVNIVVIVLAGFVLFGSKSESPVVLPGFSEELSNTKDHQQVSVTLKDKQGETKSTFIVEIVSSPKALESGLSNRAAVEGDGMLFVLPERQVPRFWMKQMLFDLDIVWIDGDRVVALTQNVPAPDKMTPLGELPVYSPDQPVTMVLEVPAGDAEKSTMQIGDQLLLMSD